VHWIGTSQGNLKPLFLVSRQGRQATEQYIECMFIHGCEIVVQQWVTS